MSLQQQISEDLGVRSQIDPEAETERRIGFLADYLRTTGARGYVLGISGGQDSTLAGRLAQLAVERVRAEGGEAKFLAVRLPYRVQHDADDAQAALEFIAPDSSVEVNIQTASTASRKTSSSRSRATSATSTRWQHQGPPPHGHAVRARGSRRAPRDRHRPRRRSGHRLLHEVRRDGAADILPLSGLTKRQGRSLLQFLDAPDRLAFKVPTADLLDGHAGRADEDELGLTYEQIDDFLEGRPVAPRGRRPHRGAIPRHAAQAAPPVTPDDTWWR